MSAPKIVLRGRRALESGRPLFVQALDGTWHAAGALERARAERLVLTRPDIYGVEAARSRVVTRWQVGYQCDGAPAISRRAYDRRTAQALVRQLRGRRPRARSRGAIRIRETVVG